MAPRVHHRAECADCAAALVFLAGDPSVGYEDIEPSDPEPDQDVGSPRVLVEHTEQRCAFHQFLTPDPARHVLPGNADWLTHNPPRVPGPAQSRLRNQRWVRIDLP